MDDRRRHRSKGGRGKATNQQPSAYGIGAGERRIIIIFRYRFQPLGGLPGGFDLGKSHCVSWIAGYPAYYGIMLGRVGIALKPNEAKRGFLVQRSLVALSFVLPAQSCTPRSPP